MATAPRTGRYCLEVGGSSWLIPQKARSKSLLRGAPFQYYHPEFAVKPQKDA